MKACLIISGGDYDDTCLKVTAAPEGTAVYCNAKKSDKEKDEAYGFEQVSLFCFGYSDFEKAFGTDFQSAFDAWHAWIVWYARMSFAQKTATGLARDESQLWSLRPSDGLWRDSSLLRFEPSSRMTLAGVR